MKLQLEAIAKLLRKPVEIDEGRLAQQRARGEAADQLLKHELLAEAFQRIESVYLDAWRNSTTFDTELRERTWMAVQLLGDVKQFLINTVRTGEVATKQILKATSEH